MVRKKETKFSRRKAKLTIFNKIPEKYSSVENRWNYFSTIVYEELKSQYPLLAKKDERNIEKIFDYVHYTHGGDPLTWICGITCFYLKQVLGYEGTIRTPLSDFFGRSASHMTEKAKEIHKNIIPQITDLYLPLYKSPRQKQIINENYLNDFQKGERGISLLGIEEKFAVQRMIDAADNARLRPNEKKGKATEIVAKQLGISNATFQRIKKIIESAPEDVKKRLRNNDPNTTITGEYKKILKAEKKKKMMS